MKLFSTFITAFLVSLVTITAFAKFPQHIVRPEASVNGPAGYHSSQAPNAAMPANAPAAWNKSQRAAVNKSYWHNNHWHNNYQSYQHHKYHTDRLSKNQAHGHINQYPNQ